MAKRLLDLFCGAGGAGMGYHRAGFEVVGVDNRPQPHYPFEFHQADVLEFLAFADLSGFDVIHASPPCQRYSVATSAASKKTHPDLVVPVREALRVAGKPYVIENVVGAPLENPLLLCGLLFGLKVFRHRLFETSQLLLAPPHFAHGDVVIGKSGMVSVTGHGEHGRHGKGARIGQDGFVTVAGGGNSGLRDRTNGGLIRRRPEDGVAAWRRAMQIDWMTRDELAQAIPPAFTKWLGEQLQ